MLGPTEDLVVLVRVGLLQVNGWIKTTRSNTLDGTSPLLMCSVDLISGDFSLTATNRPSLAVLDFKIDEILKVTRDE